MKNFKMGDKVDAKVAVIVEILAALKRNIVLCTGTTSRARMHPSKVPNGENTSSFKLGEPQMSMSLKVFPAPNKLPRKVFS